MYDRTNKDYRKLFVGWRKYHFNRVLGTQKGCVAFRNGNQMPAQPEFCSGNNDGHWVRLVHTIGNTSTQKKELKQNKCKKMVRCNMPTRHGTA